MRVTATLGFALLPAVTALVCAASSAAAATGEPPLTVEAKIPLGAVKGRIDHLAVDLARHRLFVAELGNGSVSAVDVQAGRVEKRVTGLEEPQGIAYVPGADLVYVASGGDGTLRRYRGDGALATLDAASGRKLGEVRVPAHPESFQLERSGARAYVNLPKARQVGVVDLVDGKQVGRWPFDGAEQNFPMALDESAGRLFVVYRQPAILAVFDTRTGASVARLHTVGDADDVFVDAKRGRVYVTGGEGAVAIVEARGDSYSEIRRVRTISGARTSLFVPELDRLYVAARASGNEPAAIWVLRPVGGT
jgi:DNA-binding beta-propeller fold protein YncE